MRHPAFYALTRLHTRRELRRQGHSPAEIKLMMDGCDSEVIDAAETKVGGLPVVAIGDGHIIDAILDFLKSDQGKALIQALISLLLSLI